MDKSSRSGRPTFIIEWRSTCGEGDKNRKFDKNTLHSQCRTTDDDESICGNIRSRVRVTEPKNKKQRIMSSISQGDAVSVKEASFVSRKKSVIRNEDIQRVKNCLDEIWNAAPESAPFFDKDGEPSWGPVVLCEKITWEDFDQWLDAYEGDVRRWIFEPLQDDKKCGRVFMYSIPSNPHEKTAGKILQMIIEEVQNAGSSIPLIRTVEVAASPTCRLGNRRGKEPDMSISPAGLTIGGSILDNGKGFPFPNVVIEVTYKNESLDGLRQVIQNWLAKQTSVQVAIGIKIFTRRQQRYRAVFGVRSSPTMEVEFGMDAGAGPITLAFPLELLYHGVPLPAALASVLNATITIDLIALRNFINSISL